MYFCVPGGAAERREVRGRPLRGGRHPGVRGRRARGFSVTDDGAGFDTAVARRGAGLQNMGDRVEALGGSIEIASAPGSGTTVSGSIPVPAHAEALPSA